MAELSARPLGSRAVVIVRRVWQRIWPPLLAVAIAIGIWTLLVALEVRPSYVLPPPDAVADTLLKRLADGEAGAAIATTLGRAFIGFGISIVLGSVIGLAVSRFRLLRAAVGSLITGLQTMPSIAWFPLAILVFGLTEQAITFVIVLGATPSIANGLISGIDDVDPGLVRVARALGARGVTVYTGVMIPASLPSYLSGLKQGWAFAWRSLMAGELLVIIASRPSLGVSLQFDRELANAPGLVATMIIILVIGTVIDLLFSRIANAIRERRGMTVVNL